MVDGKMDVAAFDDGVAEGIARPERLMARLFSLRAEGLLNGLAPDAAWSRLSGLLIGEELRTQALSTDRGPVILIGSAALTLRYTLALQHLNIDCQSLGAEATWAGLFALASFHLAASE